MKESDLWDLTPEEYDKVVVLAVNQHDQLVNELAHIKSLMGKVIDDLLIRGDIGEDGKVIVNLSHSLWNKINDLD